MMTAQSSRTKYRHITEFSRQIGLHRTWVFDLLERNDPDTWTKFAAFKKEKVAAEKQAVEAAKKEIAKLEAL